MKSERPDILEVAPDELASWLKAQGEPAYRLGQILDWVYARQADSAGAMSNLPAELRGRLDAAFRFGGLGQIEQVISQDGRTGKLLLELDDGERIESVWMNDAGRPSTDSGRPVGAGPCACPVSGGHAGPPLRVEGRRTFCISSQAGCPLGCRFCATGAAGLARDLAPGEILGQVTALARAGGPARNVVLMGMGEPLLNLGAVLPALLALTDPRRFGLSPRHLAVSTAGVTPGIVELAKCAARPRLALSLNSPFDKQRSELMPVNRQYPLAGVLDACEDYAQLTRRRLTLEYVLLGGVNSSRDTARAVASIARRLRALVNVIPFNAVPGCGYESPGREEVRSFKTVLKEEEHVAVTERFRRGRDIGAACGQLRGKHVAAESTK